MRTPPDGATLVLRADGDAHIGGGHLGRCGALADAWRRSGGAATLVTHAPQPFVRHAVDAGVHVITLGARYPDGRDLETTLTALAVDRAKGTAPWIVVDGYHFDAAYRSALRAAGARVVYIADDPAAPSGAADVLLNQNVGADDHLHACPAPLMLLGTRYALLRPEFARHARTTRDIPPRARRILVTFGGADPGNVTLTAVRALCRLAGAGEEIDAAVVLGAANPHGAAVKAAAAESGGRVRLIRDAGAPEMVKLMAWAEVAIAGGGTTCWELACMGVPVLAAAVAVNQRENVLRLAGAGVAVNVGPPDLLSPATLAEALRALCNDGARRARMAEAGRTLVDGLGAMRVARLLAALSRPGDLGDTAVIRRVRASDVLAVWHLANDPSARRHAFHPEPIPLERHCSWFRERLASASTRMWLAEIADTLAGQVRYDRIAPDLAEISYSTVAAFRGRGIGTMLLRHTWEAACRELGVQTARGLTLADNPASGRAFIRAGFAGLGPAVMHGRDCQIYERSVAAEPARADGTLR